VKRFLRSSLVGIVATIGDLAVLGLCMHLFGLPPWVSKVFALTVGTSIQFVGSRHFAFRAQKGRLQRQLRWFVVAEALALGLTVAVFQGLVSLGLPAAIASLASGSIVYFGFSYPLWRRVFRVTPDEAATAEAPQSVPPPPPYGLDRAA
jgi:putative flippase GtrA